MSRKRSWCFTYYPTNDERDHLWFRELGKSKGVRYMIVGKEIGEKCEKLHYQGYISFKNAKTFKQTKKWFKLDKIHIEEAKGNDIHNQRYCSKDDNLIIEVGEPIKQGKRSDIAKAVEIVKATNSMGEVMEQVPNYQACRHAELYLKYKEKKRPIGKIDVIWIYGSSGSGKTRKVYEDNEGKDIFCPVSYKWWEGYDGHEIVLLDDIRRDYCKFHELLKLLDIYPFRVETKGGSRQVQFKKIYITAPYSPTEMWYNHSAEDIYQLERRITHTVDIDNV